MFTLNTPKKYVREAGIISKVGEYLQNYNGKVLIIAGKTALESVSEQLIASLQFFQIDYEVAQFKGYCTHKIIHQLTEKGEAINAKVIVGIGGGSSLDTAKATAEALNVPILTIPTVAATCAAWSALTVAYTEEGVVEEFFRLKNSPVAILADTNVLVKSPVKYLQAGIADTLVKWYEFIPYWRDDDYNFAFATSLHTAKLAIESLEENSEQAIESNRNQQITTSFEKVVDAVIALAGLVGSIGGDAFKEPLAHLFHNKVTTIAETHHKLHGEKVIFGLIAQFVLERRSQQEIDKLINFLIDINQPVTFSQLGITEDIDVKIHKVAELMNIEQTATDNFPYSLSTNIVEQAIHKANYFGQKQLEKRLVNS